MARFFESDCYEMDRWIASKPTLKQSISKKGIFIACKYSSFRMQRVLGLKAIAQDRLPVVRVVQIRLHVHLLLRGLIQVSLHMHGLSLLLLIRFMCELIKTFNSLWCAQI